MRRYAAFATFLLALASAAPRPAQGGEPGTPVPPGTQLPGTDDAGRPVTLRIDAVRADPQDPGTTFYTVSMEATPGTWAPYCGPDAWGSTEAVVVPGSWDATTGTRQHDRGVTIACLSGAIGKCVRFGYKPWKSAEGVSLADAHQACVRMVRADYCGDGRSHTRDGTFIHIYDHLGIQVPAPDRPVVLEAGWGKDGATWLQSPRWGADPRAVAAECPDRLAGRVALPGVALTGEQVFARFPETLIICDHARDETDRERLPERPAPGRRSAPE